MERQLLWSLYQLLRSLQPSGTSRTGFSNVWILLTYFWSVLCDRPMCWACDPANWPAEFAGFEPPSPSTLSRRLKNPSTLRLLIQTLLWLQACMPGSERHYIDARPLCIGGSGGDRDARIGWGAGRLAKGYKIHAIVQDTGRLEALAVVPMNRNDTSMGPVLLQQMTVARGYLVGDTAYDSDQLYDLAALRGLQLVATPRVARKGLGHKRHSPHRLQGLAIARSKMGSRLLRDRFYIDRCFGSWGNVAGGLWGLPNFVRHLDRVRRWVVAKLIVISLKTRSKHKDLWRR